MKLTLMREIRFSIDRDWAQAAHGESGFAGALPVTNSWGGWPSAVGIAPYLVLQIVVSGAPNPVTGYLINIQELDTLLREEAIPTTARSLRAHGVSLTGERLLQDIHDHISTQLREAPLGKRESPRMESLRLWTTPFMNYAIHAGDAEMVELTQCFEFSASHRLHVPTMSDEENRRIFGKCNNPNGHGHNYRVEVTIAGPVSGTHGCVTPLPEFESIVKREVIDRLDHKHLNTDTAEFARVNPSVENIAAKIWELLAGQFGDVRLRRVRVWETAKTYAEYAG